MTKYKISEQISFFLTTEDALERDNFMSPEEAKAFGVIDHVVTQASKKLTETDK